VRPTACAIAFATAAVLAGCADSSASQPPTTAHLQQIANDADASGLASDAQLATLRDAAAAGALAWDDYADAVNATLACFADAGINYVGPTVDESMGFKQLGYAAQVGGPQGAQEVQAVDDAPGESRVVWGEEPTGRADPLATVAESCRESHSLWVEVAFAEQPTSLEAQDAFLESRRAGVVACAEEKGLALDSEAPIRQMLAELIEFGEEGRQCLGDISAF
jgi:hypothetical protein